MLRNKIMIAGGVLGILLIAGTAFAQTTTTNDSAVTTKITCVGTAVATREASLDAGIATHANAVTAAYNTRASSLASAYSLTTTSAVRSAVRSTWSTFT